MDLDEYRFGVMDLDEYRFGMDLDEYRVGMDTQLFVGDAKELERLRNIKDEHSRLKTKFIF